jgi:hypothetical protein
MIGIARSETCRRDIVRVEDRGLIDIAIVVQTDAQVDERISVVAGSCVITCKLVRQLADTVQADRTGRCDGHGFTL